MYTSGELKYLEMFDSKLKYKGQDIVEPVFVINVNGPSLLGRSANQALYLIKIHAVGEDRTKERENILKEYPGF